ncbi:sporulation histidine kinase inhibitor Sda [Aquibacillus sediminis]|nr:sporulation histidine kinase inhibitor Sda [Aquibacillus sediminis]
MSSLNYLSNEVLIIAFEKAIDLNLENDFIMLLESEIKERGLKF